MFRALGALGLCTSLAMLFPPTVPAEPPSATAPAMRLLPVTLTADIPPQPLAQALENLWHQTGVQYASLVVNDQLTRGAPAGLAPEEALTRLLEGTGLRYEFLNDRLVRIVAITLTPGTIAPRSPVQQVLLLTS